MRDNLDFDAWVVNKDGWIVSDAERPAWAPSAISNVLLRPLSTFIFFSEWFPLACILYSYLRHFSYGFQPLGKYVLNPTQKDSEVDSIPSAAISGGQSLKEAMPVGNYARPDETLVSINGTIPSRIPYDEKKELSDQLPGSNRRRSSRFISTEDIIFASFESGTRRRKAGGENHKVEIIVKYSILISKREFTLIRNTTRIVSPTPL